LIQSMTGFGRGECSSEKQQITVEIKAVNHRYSEIQVKLPRKYIFLEERLRRYVAAALSRGKIDVFIKIEDRLGGDQEMYIDKELAVKYYKKILELAADLNMPKDYSVHELLQLPGVLNIEESEIEAEQVWALMQPAMDEALAQLIEMRRQEGHKLAVDFEQRLDLLEQYRQKLLSRAPLVVEAYRLKLQNRIKELLGDDVGDENRVAVETALFADRASIDEELVRLESHIQQFKQMLQETQAIGRKLDFLCQEMNREVNTIGSKANDLDITRLVVEMKSELEKLREQVQNIE
jgi:uncharacterized protein (TIGR00255 family)